MSGSFQFKKRTVAQAIAAIDDDHFSVFLDPTDGYKLKGKDAAGNVTVLSGVGVTSWNDLQDKPTLFSGDYNDLQNKPSLPSALTDAEVISGSGTTAGIITPAQTKLAAQTHGHGIVKNEAGSRALVLTDDQALLIVNSASATTFTIPNDATAVWQDGAFISLYQSGAGSPAFAAGSGVTLRNPNSVAASQYGFIAAQRVGPNEWAVL